MEKQVRVDWSGYDEYQRLLANVFSQSTWINQYIITQGWAWHYIFYDQNPQLSTAQTKARATRKGLWAGINPTAPWDWRKETKKTYLKSKAGAVRIASLLPNRKGIDEGNEQITLVNITGKAIALQGWLLRDRQKNTYPLSGSIKARGKLAITMKNNCMRLNNDGDTITLLQGRTIRHTFTYNKNHSENVAVMKASNK